MKYHRVMVALVPVALCAAACAPDLAVEEEAIGTLTDRWKAYEAQGDAAGVAGLFTEDGTLHWGERVPVTGPSAIEPFLARALAEGVGDWSGDRLLMAASGDLAVEVGTWRAGPLHGRYQSVFQKVGDEWKVADDMSLPAMPHGGAPDWALRDLAAWYEAYNARDAQRLIALYSPDAKVMGAVGRAALLRRWRTSWAESDAHRCEGDYDVFRVIGPVATGLGRDRCEVTPKGGGEVTVTLSNWLVVLEQQPDGRWLLTRDFSQPIEP